MPVVAIVGRPNVGKSTLFNRILGKRKAIVDDVPGVTRDRNYGLADWDGREFFLVDTGGYDPSAESGLFPLIRLQAAMAIEEADLILFLLDVRDGLTPDDLEIAGILRKCEKPILVAANKAEGPRREMDAVEFYGLGIERVIAVSALHGTGVSELMDTLVSLLPEGEIEKEDSADVRVAVVGRPNTGKSTLINRILGEERLLVSDIPGTTKDAVDTLVKRKGRHYLLVDTAGVRRKSRISQDLEKHSVMRTIHALDRCDVCLLLTDSVEGLVDQDLRIAGLAADRGRGLVLGLNKWDLVEKDHKTFDRMSKEIREKLFFMPNVPIISMSGLYGLRVDRMFDTVEAVFMEAGRRVPTSLLNSLISDASERHQPHLVRGRRVKFYYGTQVGTNPPTFVIFTNRPGEIKTSYIKFLERRIREEFGFAGTPIRIRFRGREKGKK